MKAFMDYYQNVIDYYHLVKEKYPDSIEEYANFYTCFETNWLSLISAEDSKFEFNLWSYNDKFNFKGYKKN